MFFIDILTKIFLKSYIFGSFSNKTNNPLTYHGNSLPSLVMSMHYLLSSSLHLTVLSFHKSIVLSVYFFLWGSFQGHLCLWWACQELLSFPLWSFQWFQFVLWWSYPFIRWGFSLGMRMIQVQIFATQSRKRKL